MSFEILCHLRGRRYFEDKIKVTETNVSEIAEVSWTTNERYKSQYCPLAFASINKNPTVESLTVHLWCCFASEVVWILFASGDCKILIAHDAHQSYWPSRGTAPAQSTHRRCSQGKSCQHSSRNATPSERRPSWSKSAPIDNNEAFIKLRGKKNLNSRDI